MSEASDNPQAMPARTAEHRHGGLGQLASTAICGNDITSSCLYVSALAIVYAGRWAPVCLLLVAGTLYLFRSIYAEVVGALPLNGGAYNALLNTTSKYRASIAACLTILSYMATAVISSNEAMHYLHSLWEGLPVMCGDDWLAGTVHGAGHHGDHRVGGCRDHHFRLSPRVDDFADGGRASMRCLILGSTSFGRTCARRPRAESGKALFFGFAAAMLGISGFESSANFVEEQAEGVFPKTLRNMWIAVTILNPGMAILALALVPIPEVRDTYQNTLLSHMGATAGGNLACLVDQHRRDPGAQRGDVDELRWRDGTCPADDARSLPAPFPAEEKSTQDAASHHHRVLWLVRLGVADHARRTQITGRGLYAFVFGGDGIVCDREPVAESKTPAVAASFSRIVSDRAGRAWPP